MASLLLTHLSNIPPTGKASTKNVSRFSPARRRFLTLVGMAPFGIGCRSFLYPGLHGADKSSLVKGRSVVILTERKRQRIEHFGASDCWSMEPIGKSWSEKNKERFADLLFSRDKGIGLSLWRFNLGAGDPNPDGYSALRYVETMQPGPNAPIDSGKQVGQQWFLKAAKKRGVEKTMAFVNSPPVWLTKNGRGFASKDEKGTNLKVGSERAFGKYLVDVLRHFDKKGLAFDYVSPINEPNWRWNGGQEGCSYNIGEMRRTTFAVAKELQAAKIPAQITIGEMGDHRALLDDMDYRLYNRIAKPDVTFAGTDRGGEDSASHGYLQGLFGDAAFREAVGNCFLSHSYWSDSSPHDLSELRKRLRGNFDRYAPGGQLWQSEYCVMEHKRDLGMDMAIRVASVIHHDLADAEVNSWSWWIAVSTGDYKDGLIYADGVNNSDEPKIVPSKTLWALGNWSRFVRPGAQRVESFTGMLPDELLATAYISANGRDLIVVVVNPATTTLPVQFNTDREIREFTPYVTDATRDLHQEKAVPADTPVSIPARSVVTLIGRLGKTTEITGADSLRKPAHRELEGEYLYSVQCGLSDTEPSASARRNSRQDMRLGRDPGTGYTWGYLTYGRAGGHKVEQPKPNATAPEASPAPQELIRSARLDEGDTPGQGITYRFEVEPNQSLLLEVGWFDPWNSPNRHMDVLVQGETVEKSLLPGNEYLVRRYKATSTPQGIVELRVVRSPDNAAPDADPLISHIRVQAA